MQTHPPVANARPAIIRTITLLLLTVMFTGVLAQGVSVTDYLGRQVELDAPATRIVSLMPSHTELLVALGAGDLLKGVDEASPLPEGTEAVRLGNGFSPNLELIVSLEPDLVLVDEFTGVHMQLEELGLLAFAGTPDTLEGTLAFNSIIGMLTGRESEAAELTRQQTATVDTVRERAASLPQPRVYIELDSTPFSAGPGSYIDDLLQVAGGENVVTEDMGSWPMLSPEFVVSSQPDVILLLNAPYGESEESFRSRPGFSGIAVQVFEVEDFVSDLLSRPGPGLEAALQWLFSALHGDAADE